MQTDPAGPDFRSLCIRMKRDSLERIPRHDLPPGFSWRTHRPGDEALWVRIYCRSFEADAQDPFPKEFRGAGRDTKERVFYLMAENGDAVGTATAWMETAEVGRVHWVTIVPEFQGRGLAKPLMTRVLNRLRDLGYRSAMLITQPVRIPAIHLYLDFGFVPDIVEERQRPGWAYVAARLRHPALEGLAGA